MKKIILSFILLNLSLCLYSQERWESLPVNPNIASSTYDIEMADGKIFQIYYQNNAGTDQLVADFYNPQTLSWQNHIVMNSPVFSRVKTEKIGNIIYVAAYDGSDFYFYQVDVANAAFSTLTVPYTFAAVNNNWEFHSGNNTDELYVLFTTGTGPSDVHGLEYITGGTWGYITETSGQDLSVADLQISSSATDVYFGVYSNVVRLTRFVKGNIAVMFAYDGLVGNVLSNGSNWDNSGFVLSGNEITSPYFYGTEDLNNLSYETQLSGVTIDINLAAPTTDYNLDANYLTKESSPSHSFIMSLFSDDGVGNPNDKLFVIRKDITIDGPWDTLATRLLPQGTALDQNSLHLSIDNAYHHIASAYTQFGAGTNELQVSNQVPYHMVGSNVANTGLCAGQMNELYSNIQLMDDDFDQVTILSATSVNATTTNISVIPNGFANGVSMFKVLGNPAASSDQIQITYTDGYNTYVDVLLAFSGNTTPPNVQFLANPVILCANEQQVDLTQHVNYYDQGAFELNGLDLNGTLINAMNLNILGASGTLRYYVDVNGCIVEANANYLIVTPPAVSVTVGASVCGLNNGDATATVVAGSSSNTSFYWSTGETALSIANLVPGAYYAHVNDDNNCHATALAAVVSTGITLTPTIVDPSCHGLSDGSIDVAVSGTSSYQFMWSTGHATTTISNMPAGSYEYTLYDNSGCEITGTYVLTDPAALQNNFVVNRPDCASSNGSLKVVVTGGQNPYTRLWSTSATTALISNLSQGYYSVVITDNNNCVLRDSIFLNDNYASIIQDSIILSACDANNGGIDLTMVDHPLGGPVNWVQWDNGATSEDLFNLYTGNYMVTVNSGANCKAQASYFVGIRQPLRNDICVVTVDTSNTTNLIVWEKMETQGISHYNIYRENGIAGTYMLIDTVQFNNLSVFNDVVASPLQRSWRYRIAAVNTCNVEGPLSIPHKTVHLNTINQVTPGVVDVYWDDYEGLTAAEYVVYRYTDQNGWEVLAPTIPFGNPTVYTDTPPVGITGLDYFVGLDLLTPCTATFRSQDFNTSRSNKERGIFNPGEGTDYSNNNVIEISKGGVSLSVNPNPFADEINFVLDGSSTAQIELIDIHGKQVVSLKINEGLYSLNTSALKSGVYFVKANINGSMEIRRIVK